MSRVVPVLLGIFGHGTLVVMSCRTSWDIPSCPRTSWDLWNWDFGSHVSSCLGIFGPGTFVIMFYRSFWNVLSCPRTSWDLLT